VALAAAILIALPLRLFPILGGLYYLFLPSALLVLASATAGALVVSLGQVTFKTYAAVVGVVFGLLTVSGLYLRQQGDRQGSAGV